MARCGQRRLTDLPLQVVEVLEIAAAEAHRARLARYVEPHLERRRLGIKHPVHDFLFTYYAYRPAQLMAWHPAGPLEAHKRPLVDAVHRLMQATLSRPGNFGCFGMHEWAMVYRLPESSTRHNSWPLRLGGSGTDSVVEGHRVACSHFDAFRFFTAGAVPLNTLSPGRDDRPDFEQPACLHAGMDLYKHAFRLAPMVPAELVADCFELAWDIRVLDMRAAPYDLTGVTLDPTGEPWTPVRVETADGKVEYAEAQRAFAQRARPLRQRLLEECDRLLA